MDEIENFFDISKDFKREEKSHPLKLVADEPSCSNKDGKRENKAVSFSSAKRCKVSNKYPTTPAIDVTCASNYDAQITTATRISDDVYGRYRFDLNRDESLPIYDVKEDILNAVRNNSAVIIQGCTGSGKTTQVPQYILDDAYRRKEYCNIICTQPRRIAAISISRRVSMERKWTEGTVVGYQVGLHVNISDDTRLLYCTTGVLLQKLIREKTLRPYTHIILDEVHEREQDMDFLLILIRKLMVTNSKHVKIILMSATIDTEVFSKYFTIQNLPAPILRADTRRLFEVREFYLCDLDRINNNKIDIDLNEPGIKTDMFNLALKLIVVIDNIEKQEANINLDLKNNQNQNSILIFLPGINEIDVMYKKVEKINKSEGTNIHLYPIRLHSIISPDEQIKVFHRPPPGYRKVILATNIAESSITVPDVKYVIDFCLIKMLVTDTCTNLSTLEIKWASKASCRQRAGRAGRIMNGRVYRLIPRTFFEDFLDEFNVPEILRCPLDSIVLKAKLLDMGPPPAVLSQALSPPDIKDIRNTILTLKETGALCKYADGIYSEDDGDLSYMGLIMASLPIDLRFTRLIVLGYLFGTIEESIVIAAGLSVRSIFKFQSYHRLTEVNAYIKKLKFSNGSGSDLIAILRAYTEWIRLRNESNENLVYAWAQENFINIRSLAEMRLLIIEIANRLKSFKIKVDCENFLGQTLSNEKHILLKVIIAGAFYPNYFNHNNRNDHDRGRSTYHIMCGKNPCNTVYFTNFDTRHIGQLYSHSIKMLFKDINIRSEDMNVFFQPCSEKVFVVFKNNREKYSSNTVDEIDDNFYIPSPGAVCTQVYTALRMRQVNLPTTIDVMNISSEVKYAKECGLGTICDGEWITTKRVIKNAELYVYPSLFQKNMTGYITHIESCSNFFFQPLCELERLQEIQYMLNNPFDLENCRFSRHSEVTVGLILSAPFEEKYHRGKVIKLIELPNKIQYKILFIDYGNTAVIDFHKLRLLSDRCKSLNDIPPRLFECRLALIEPSTVISPNGQWVDEAMEVLQEYADSGIIEIEVFSVVDGLANIIVKKGNTTINATLVSKGLARTSDECFMSKNDHSIRLRKQSIANRFLDEDHSRQNEEYLQSIYPDDELQVTPPPRELCSKKIELRGPFSPVETNLFSAMRVGTWKSVVIERDSVNYINVDHDPKNMYERLVVAASVAESHRGDSLVARGTTQMPNIHGFGALMTLLFCPTAQIKCNHSRTKYVAILAGLGYHPDTMEPLYGEHDIVLNLDVDISPADIEIINNIRHLMDQLIPIGGSSKNQSNQMSDLLKSNLQQFVLRLLNRNRKFIDHHIDPNDSKWQKLDPNDLIKPSLIYGHKSIFPQLSSTRLYEEKFDQIHTLNLNCHELHRLSQFDGHMQSIDCALCQQPIENIVQLRIHLLSQLHRDREEQIHFQAIK